MASMVNIFHKPNGQSWENITNSVMADGFPDVFQETLKGEGANEYRVKEFTFNLHISSLNSTPERLDFFRIEEASSGVVLLNGFLDEIRQEFSPTPEFTVFPNALLLKDTMVGETINPEEEGEDPITEFEFMATPRPLHELVEEVAISVNAKRGTNFTADSDSVPTAESEIRSFFGNILFRTRQFGFINFLTELIFGTDSMEIRKKTDSNYPSGKKYTALRYDNGFFIKTLISKGHFLSFSWGFYLGWPFSFTIGFSINVPFFNWRFPTIGAYIFAYDCVGGGMGSVINSYEFFPLPPFFGSWPNLNVHGTKLNNMDFTGMSNVAQSKITQFLRGEGWENPEILKGWDYDSNNTYVVARAKRPSDIIGFYQIFLSMETPFDNEYRLHYRNKNGSDILKDLAIVSNRWFYVDPSDKIHLLPRNDSNNTVEIIEHNLLEKNRKTEKNSDATITVQRYDKDSDTGKVSKYGIVLRKNELDAIESQYKAYSQSTRQEYNIKLFNPPTGDDRIMLMDEIVVTESEGSNPYSIGRVIELEQSFKDNWVRFKTEISDDFTLMQYTEEQEDGEGPDPDDMEMQIFLPQTDTQFHWDYGPSLYITWVYVGDGWYNNMALLTVSLLLEQWIPGSGWVYVANIVGSGDGLLDGNDNDFNSSLAGHNYNGVNTEVGNESYRIKLSIYDPEEDDDFGTIRVYRQITIIDTVP